MAINDADYFSLLPDALLLVIISFLPFKEAVRASLLSKRWRNLWQSSRNIDLDENFFVRRGTISGERDHFMAFLRRWMANYDDSGVEKFRLATAGPPRSYDLTQLQECIGFVVDHNGITSLDLDFSDRAWDENDLHLVPETTSLLRLPQLKAEMEATLESLGLSAVDLRWGLSRTDRFSALKNVFFGWMRIPGLNGLLTGCPLLENVGLRRCWDVGNLDIQAKRLRVLVVDKCLGFEYVCVNAPLLWYFRYSGVSVYLQVEGHRNMEQVVLDFGVERQCGDEDDAEMLYNLLSQLWCVRVLRVCSYMLQVLPLGEELMLKSRLASVRHLHLKTQLHVQEFYGITFLLNSCPMLEHLTIHLGPMTIFEDYEFAQYCRLEEHPFVNNMWYPLCLESSLKRVDVMGFKGEINELIVVKFLMKFGRVLEDLYMQVVVSNENGGVEEMEATCRQKVLQFDVRSPHLRLHVAKMF